MPPWEPPSPHHVRNACPQVFMLRGRRTCLLLPLMCKLRGWWSMGYLGLAVGATAGVAGSIEKPECAPGIFQGPLTSPSWPGQARPWPKGRPSWVLSPASLPGRPGSGAPGRGRAWDFQRPPSPHGLEPLPHVAGPPPQGQAPTCLVGVHTYTCLRISWPPLEDALWVLPGKLHVALRPHQQSPHA